MMTTICKQSNNQQEEKTYELYMILLVHGLFLDKNDNLGGALSNTAQRNGCNTRMVCHSIPNR